MANLNRFDLNLLVALDTLLSERSVTRAADRLCVTQPALSGSLQRLRYHFDDPLLVRVGREMELTPKARALIEPVRNALLQVNVALETQAVFDPASSERTFRIAMSDYCAHVFLPHVVRRLATRAPHMRLVTENVFGPSFSRLDGGDIDIIITHGDRRLFGREGTDTDLLTTALFEDDFVCVVAADHPVTGSAMTMDDFLHYPHALVDFGTNVRTVEEAEIERQGIVINDKYLVPTFGGLLYLLAGTQLIATVQRRLAALLAPNLDVRVMSTPVNLMLRETLVWHQRSHDDPAQLWLRELLLEAGRELD